MSAPGRVVIQLKVDARTSAVVTSLMHSNYTAYQLQCPLVEHLLLWRTRPRAQKTSSRLLFMYRYGTSSAAKYNRRSKAVLTRETFIASAKSLAAMVCINAGPCNRRKSMLCEPRNGGLLMALALGPSFRTGSTIVSAAGCA